MIRDVKFFDKYYVGFQKDRYATEEKFRMLGFAVPNTANAAFKKRKETVDRWAQKDLAPIDMDNKPTHGFKVVDTVSRYSTSNKFFRVEDPRGFELEINVENLLDIIEKHTIVQGTIMEPMLWGRFGTSGNYLISGNSPEYKQHINGKEVVKLEPGVYLRNRASNVIYRFEGKFAYNLLGSEIIRKDPDSRHYYYSYHKRPREDFSKVSSKVITYVDRKQSSPAYVYTEYHVGEDGITIGYAPTYRRELDARQRAKIVIRKSEIKDLIPMTENEVKCAFIKSFVLPIGEKLKEVDYEYKHRETDEIIETTNYEVDMNLTIGSQTVPVLFNTKKESMEKQYTQEELLNFFKPFDHATRYGYDQHPNFYGSITYIHKDSLTTENMKEKEE